MNNTNISFPLFISIMLSFNEYSVFHFGTKKFIFTYYYHELSTFHTYCDESNDIISIANTLWEDINEIPISNQTLKVVVSKL